MAKREKPLILGEVLKKWRLMKDLDLRTVAEQVGISAPTLMRIEQGQSCDAETWLKMQIWLFSERKI